MHVEQIQKNLKLYQDAQKKLATMMKQMVNDSEKEYYAIVKISDDFYLYAGMKAIKTLVRVDLCRDFGVDGDITPIASGVPYLDFIRAFPEFGRRDIWKNDWEPCQKLFELDKNHNG